MAVARDLKKEQQAVGTYQGIYKAMPNLNDPQARANLYKLAYPTELPKELASSIDASLYAGAGIDKIGNALPQDPASSNIALLRQNVAGAQAGVEKTSQPNEALRVLQEAVRQKAGTANQSVGTSDIFKQAGVTGYDALSQSLKAQGDKLQGDFSNFQNVIGQMSGTYKDMATSAANKYNMAYAAYNDEVNRLQKIQDDLRQHKEAIDLANNQYQNNVKLEAYRNSHPDVNTQLSAGEKGYDIVDGQIQQKGWNEIISPSGHKYDWKTYNAVGTPEDQKNYIKSVQSSIMKVGKLGSPQELDAWIKKNMPKSNITANDVMAAAESKGTGWEEILGLIQKEAPGAASNVALKNNNFGGITWSPTYQKSHPNAMKGSARPASEGGYYVKFKTVREGLEAQAEQFAKRDIGMTTDGAMGVDLTAKAQDFAVKNTKVMFGGNPSEGERKAAEDFYKRKVAEGVTDEQSIMNEFVDYKVNKNDVQFGDNLKNVVVQNLPTGKTFKDAGARDLANLINNGKKGEAVRKVETMVYAKARTEDPENFLSESTAKLATNNVNELAALVRQLNAKGNSPIGNFQGTLTDWLGRFKGNEAAQIKTKIVTLVSKMRKDLSGSAVTPSEEQFLKPLIPELGDTAENFITKATSLKTSPLNRLNSVRTTFGMPELNEDALLDQNKRVDVYGNTTGGETSDGMTDEQAYQEYLKIKNQ